MFRTMYAFFTLIPIFIFSPLSVQAFSQGESYECSFNQILRFYNDRDPYFTESYSNQSPFSFIIKQDTIKMGENWFVGSEINIIDISNQNITAFNGSDLVKIFKRNNKVFGYAGSLDNYIKMFNVNCKKT
jgi:hypothetical protein